MRSASASLVEEIGVGSGDDAAEAGPALCFLGPGAKPKLEAPNKQNLPTSLYQLQSLFRCIIKKILMVKTIAYKYIKSITGIPNPYLLNR